MTKNTENLILEHLQAMRASIDRVESDVRETKARLSHLEISVTGIRRDLAHGEESIARQQAGIENLSARIDRIERRLDLV